MMSSLIPHILDNPREFLFTDSECGEAILPVEVLDQPRFMIQEMAARTFDLSHDGADRMRRRYHCDEMAMIIGHSGFNDFTLK